MKTIVKLISAALIVAMMCTGLSVAAAETITGDDGVIDVVGSLAEERNDTPLLAILVNFDADGDGFDDWDPNQKDKLYSDVNAPYYGEQWALTNPNQHYKYLFSDTENSVNTYYKEMTLNHIGIVPVKFDNYVPSWTLHEGVIEVTINQMHPTAYQQKVGNNASAFCSSTIKAAVDATDPYIDYSKYDRNGDGIIGQDELLLLVINPGSSQETNGSKACDAAHPQSYFSVWSTSQGLTTTLDGVKITSTTGGGRVFNEGEYTTVGTLQKVGTTCHELAHNLGAEDIYNRGGSNTVADWPLSGWLSLQCSGNYSGGGHTPTYLDPYQRIYLGWAESVTVGEGTYTIHSTTSGKYAVLRVNTPDPDEYFLIEVRLKKGFESNITSAKTNGGIMVWHIDETINRKYFVNASACTSNPVDGVRHDPGIVALAVKENCYTKASDYCRVIKDSFNNKDCFYHADGSSIYQSCDTMDFGGAQSGSHGLNSYPDGWIGEKYFNVHVEVLSEAGDDMTVNITTESRGKVIELPVCESIGTTTDSMTFRSTFTEDIDEEILECGVICSTKSSIPDDDSITVVSETNDKEFTVTANGLLKNKRYYYKSYYKTESGIIYSKTANSLTAKYDKTQLVVHNAEVSELIPEINVGEVYSAPAPNPRDGMVFDGWFADEGLTIPFDFSVPSAQRGNVDIYAKWTEVTTEATTVATTEATTEATTAEGTAPGGCGSTMGIGAMAVAIVTLLGTCIITSKKQY